MILVIGGTRGTGLLIAQLLVRRGFAVRVLARNPVGARASFGTAVDIVEGDITIASTLPRALDGVTHIIFTAGCRSGYPAAEARIRATEYDGVLNTLAAAQEAGFVGRFLYMTSSGVTRRSLFSVLLNLYKGNTLIWRQRAERVIRSSALDYTIIRTGVLLNQPGGQRAILLTQDPLPLSIRYRIARADVAEAFVAALDHPRASRATCEVISGRGPRTESWSELLAHVKPDREIAPAAG